MTFWRRLSGRLEQEGEPPPVPETAWGEQPDAPEPASPAHLLTLRDLGDAPLTDGTGTFRLRTERLGTLPAPTGRIVACDPLTWSAKHPVVVSVPPGAYEVEVVHREAAGGSRVAFALLVLGAGPTATWSDEVSYGVDTGTSCFADAAALGALSERSRAYYAQERLEGEEPLVDAMAERHAVMYETARDEAIAAFASGLGDGWYSAWVGRDAAGAPAAVLTSFDIVAAQTRCDA